MELSEPKFLQQMLHFIKWADARGITVTTDGDDFLLVPKDMPTISQPKTFSSTDACYKFIEGYDAGRTDWWTK